MRRLDRISGAVLFIVAAVLFFQTRPLTFWAELGPAEGFFPLILSLMLGGLSVLILLRASFAPEQGADRARILGPNAGKFLAYLALFFFFAVAFPRIGYTLTLAIFLVVILRWVEGQSWKITLLMAALLLISSHVLFVRLLNIAIPEGPLAPLLYLGSY